ncbi:hypothetical protein GIB67_030869, partial [Kingdonia uniflora]
SLLLEAYLLEEYSTGSLENRLYTSLQRHFDHSCTWLKYDGTGSHHIRHVRRPYPCQYRHVRRPYLLQNILTAIR